VRWVDGEAPPACVVFQGQTLSQVSERDLLATDASYANGWVCDGCRTQRGGGGGTGSQTEWIYHGAVEVQENAYRFAPIYTKNDQFTKTGLGQT
jgi:hypothetical protein